MVNYRCYMRVCGIVRDSGRTLAVFPISDFQNRRKADGVKKKREHCEILFLVQRSLLPTQACCDALHKVVLASLSIHTFSVKT